MRKYICECILTEAKQYTAKNSHLIDLPYHINNTQDTLCRSRYHAYSCTGRALSSNVKTCLNSTITMFPWETQGLPDQLLTGVPLSASQPLDSLCALLQVQPGHVTLRTDVTLTSTMSRNVQETFIECSLLVSEISPWLWSD